MSRVYAEEIIDAQHRAKWRRNADFFRGCRKVMDLGCGPGHFMAALQSTGIASEGIDLEEASLKACRSKGFTVRKAGANAALRRLKPGGVDGIHCSNLLEHLHPEEVRELLRLAASRLPHGGRLALSTANPACLGLVCNDFWQDIQHIRFYPAELLRRECESVGLRVQFAGGDESTRPQSPARSLLRALRSRLVGPYFGPPEVLILAHKA